MEYNELVKALRCDGNNIGQDSGGCTNKKCRYRDPDSACKDGKIKMMCDVLQCEHNEDGFCCTSCFIDEGGMCVTMRLLPP